MKSHLKEWGQSCKDWLQVHKKKVAIGVVILLAIIGGGAYYSHYRWEAYIADHRLVLQGNVNYREVNVAFHGSERITELAVDAGATVKKGQLLGKLNTQELTLAVQQAKDNVAAQESVVAKLKAGNRTEDINQSAAQVNSAQADANYAAQNFARIQNAYTASGGKSVSKQDLDQAQSKVQVANAKLEAAQQAYQLMVAGPRQEDITQAEAQLAAAKSELAKEEFLLAQSTLVAPEDGVITQRLLQVGDMATPSTPVFKLALTHQKWVRVYVDEKDLGKIHSGMKAQVTTDTYPNSPLEGTIGYIASVAEFTPKSVETKEVRTSMVYEVRVYVNDPHNELRLGMPATVTIDI